MAFNDKRILIVALLIVHSLSHNGASGSIFIRKELLPCEVELQSPGKTESANLTSCSRKLFLSLKIIQDEQGQNDHQFVIVDSAIDGKTQEEVRLLEPLVIKVVQQPVTLAYPFKYLFAANNRPYEVTINKGTSTSYTGCDPLATYQPTCQTYEHLAPNRAKNGKAITQGFCCPCEPANVNNPRENLVCDDKAAASKEGIDPQGTTHCLKFDPVWYSVYSLNSPNFHHKVGIGIYTEDVKKTGQRLWKPIVPNLAKFSLGTQNKRFQHEKFAASYVEITKKPASFKSPLDHEHQVLLIPQPHIAKEELNPPQTKQGPEEFLVVNKSMVDQTGNSCDKIGVSYGAFDRQPNRCHSMVNSCLGNSIQNMWLQDMKSASSGQLKKYLLSAFGKLSVPSVMQEPNLDPLLLFNITYEHISHVYIDINADLIQTVSQVRGEIVEGISLSDGSTTEIEVNVHNKGLVATVFTTQITECSSPLEVNGKHTEAIGPYASATFLFKLRHKEQGIRNGISSCKVELLNSSGKKIAERRINYQPTHRCFCIAQCSCKCTSEPEWHKCEMMNKEEFTVAGFKETLQTRKTSHEKDLAWALRIMIIILLLLLLLGVLKCIINLSRSLWSSFCNRGLYKDIRPPFKEHALKQICLDVWFFYYCPFWLIYLCVHHLIKRCSRKDEQDLQRQLPEQKRSELFIETAEDTGKLALSDSEDEVGSKPPTETDKLSVEGKTDDVSRNTLASTYSTNNENTAPVNMENENNSRSLALGEEESPLGKCVSEEPQSDFELPLKVSSSTSVLSKEVIESKFRKQKAQLNGDLEAGVGSEYSGNEGSIVTSDRSSTNKTYLESTENVQGDLDEEPISGADIEALNVLSHTGRPVYFNHVGKTDLLQKSGDHFSLCGSLRKSGFYYKFSLGPYNTQIFWNKRGKLKRLATPLPISTKNFVHVMTGAQTLQQVTLEPRYLCLNYVM